MASEPGPTIDILTPTFQWVGVPGADCYTLAISEYPYGTSRIIYNPQRIASTSHAVPAGVLKPGVKYRWNMQAHSPADWSQISKPLYFQTRPSVLSPQQPVPPVTSDNPPNVTAFSASASEIQKGQTITLSYSVADDVGLSRVELWRADDTAGVDFRKIPPDHPISGKQHSGSFSDTPPSPGTYRYGLHVVDSAGKWNCERNSESGSLPGIHGPRQVVVVAAPIIQQLQRISDPNPSEINAEIERLALEYSVPPIIIQAICWNENRWVHIDPATGRPAKGLTNDFGLMQVTEQEAAAFPQYADWKDNWKTNLRLSVRILVERKWAKNEVPEAAGKLILENWYYPVAWYNGYGLTAYDYVGRAYGFMQNPPSEIATFAFCRRVDVGSPRLIPGWDTDKNIRQSGNKPYQLSQIVQAGGHIHRWNGKMGTALLYEDVTAQYARGAPQQPTTVASSGPSGRSELTVTEPPFCLPTEGTLGYRYQEGDHLGIDVWSGVGWDSARRFVGTDVNPPGKPIHLPYAGTLRAIIRNKGNTTVQGLIFRHSIDPQYGTIVPELEVETIYLHMASEQSRESYVNPALLTPDAIRKAYPKGFLLGWQGNQRWNATSANENVIVHLHFALRYTKDAPSSTTLQGPYRDPSPYLGYQLNVEKPNALPKGFVFLVGGNRNTIPQSVHASVASEAPTAASTVTGAADHTARLQTPAIDRVTEVPSTSQANPQQTTPGATRAEEPTARQLSAQEQAQAAELWKQAEAARRAMNTPSVGKTNRRLVAEANKKRLVDLCRQIIRQYPDSEYAAKARQALASLPEADRKRYGVTDQETATGKK